MKFCATLTLLALLAGCREKAGQPQTETTASTATTSETTTTIVENATAPGGTVSTVPPADKEFAASAGIANLAELEMGKLAAQKASNAQVKAYAERMVTDHNRIGNAFSPLATAKGIALPAELAGAAKSALDHLASLDGAAFDKAFIEHMVADHKAAETLFSTEARSGGDADLRGFSGTWLPVIQEHLKLAQALSSRLP